MITASKSPVAIREQNFFLLAVAKSFFVATIMFAEGYSCKNSAANCSMMWFGTTKIDLLQSPSLLLSIAPSNHFKGLSCSVLHVLTVYFFHTKYEQWHFVDASLTLFLDSYLQNSNDFRHIHEVECY